MGSKDLYSLVKHTFSDYENKRYKNCGKRGYELHKNGIRLDDSLYSTPALVSVEKVNELFKTNKYVLLEKLCEGRYSDNLMVTCHGKNWKKDKCSPYNLLDWQFTVLDTETEQFAYTEPTRDIKMNTYGYIFESVLYIIDNSKHKMFDLNKQELILETVSGKLYETVDNVVFCVNDYSHPNKVYIINKKTCQIKKVE